MAKETMTPMMKQYYELKNQHQDKFLFFRLGDFYELFDEDAKKASKLLSILLTQRNGVAMCGIPHHQFHNYAYKIIHQGKKIAIAEQIANVEQSEGEKIILRKVTKILSPGMILDENILKEKENNFILFFYFATASNNQKKSLQLFNLDISTGEVFISVVKNEWQSRIKSYLLTYQPKEVVFLEGNAPNDFLLDLKDNFPTILVNSLNSLTISESEKNALMESIFPSGVVIELPLQKIYDLFFSFIIRNGYENILFLKKPVDLDLDDFLLLDYTVLKHLEIFESQYEELGKYTLFNSINHTLTAMGERLFKRNLAKPLKDKNKIEKRLDIISAFKKNPVSLLDFRHSLKNIFDLERMVVKIQNSTITPRQVVSLIKNLKTSLTLIDFFHREFYFLLEIPYFKNIITDFLKQEKLFLALEKKLLANPNSDLKEGGVINPEVDQILKELSLKEKNNLAALNSIEKKVKREVGVSTLKVKYNGNLGFFFEVSKNHVAKIPPTFIKKQSLVNVERFVSEELVSLESEVVRIKELMINRETIIYQQIIQDLKDQKAILSRVSSLIAQVDFYSALAFLANKWNYVRPQFNAGRSLVIQNARHPVVEQLADNDFIPNSLKMSDDNYFHLITGPNMAGKSTFLRQNALIVILAQMGSFVPATSATLPIFDRIFTRIGSGDKLVKGESTFMVEMKEVATILQYCTEDSFVIMDEIGRGTSTYDGLAIAGSIIDYFINQEGKKTKTLFATHYHELGKLAEENSKIENYTVAVKETHKEIIFLKKVEKGLTNKSYGIYVAELAGIPWRVTALAKKILAKILMGKDDATIVTKQMKNIEENEENNFLENQKRDNFLNEIKELDTNNLTPLAALNWLVAFKEKIKKDE